MSQCLVRVTVFAWWRGGGGVGGCLDKYESPHIDSYHFTHPMVFRLKRKGTWRVGVGRLMAGNIDKAAKLRTKRVDLTHLDMRLFIIEQFKRRELCIILLYWRNGRYLTLAERNEWRTSTIAVIPAADSRLPGHFPFLSSPMGRSSPGGDG